MLRIIATLLRAGVPATITIAAYLHLDAARYIELATIHVSFGIFALIECIAYIEKSNVYQQRGEHCAEAFRKSTSSIGLSLIMCGLPLTAAFGVSGAVLAGIGSYFLATKEAELMRTNDRRLCYAEITTGLLLLLCALISVVYDNTSITNVLFCASLCYGRLACSVIQPKKVASVTDLNEMLKTILHFKGSLFSFAALQTVASFSYALPAAYLIEASKDPRMIASLLFLQRISGAGASILGRILNARWSRLGSLRDDQFTDKYLVAAAIFGWLALAALSAVSVLDIRVSPNVAMGVGGLGFCVMAMAAAYASVEMNRVGSFLPQIVLQWLPWGGGTLAVAAASAVESGLDLDLLIVYSLSWLFAVHGYQHAVKGSCKLKGQANDIR